MLLPRTLDAAVICALELLVCLSLCLHEHSVPQLQPVVVVTPFGRFEADRMS